MIEVSVQKDEIRVLGHSGYAPPGQDIVCAAVSTLTQGLIASIEGLTGDRPDYTIAPGVFILSIKDLSEKSKLLVDSFFLGISMIAREYPECVKFCPKSTLNYCHRLGQKTERGGNRKE